jgi:uncharacterized membrane protein (DUF4010 family)
MFYQPGKGDLILAEFQAKLRARAQEPHPDEAEATTRRWALLMIRWTLLVAIVVWIYFSTDSVALDVALAIFLILGVVGEIWWWAWRSRREAEDQAGSNL